MWQAPGTVCLKLASLLVTLVFAVPSLADSWDLPEKPYSVDSGAGDWKFRVVPSLGTTDNATGTLYRVRHWWPDKRIWSRPLLNVVAPVVVLIPDSGQFVVTLDEWHGAGTTSRAVVIYGAMGELVRSFALEDLATRSEISEMFHSTTSIWWRGRVYFSPDEKALQVELIRTKTVGPIESIEIIREPIRIVTIRLSDGAILDPPPST
jgi:hypothetical protein